MESWIIEAYEDEKGNEPVNDFILTLTSGEKGRLRARLEALRQNGFNTGNGYIDKIRGKIWELRLPGSPHNPRILFFATVGRKIVLLHGFKKIGKSNDKVPEKDIRLAENRMSDFLRRKGSL